MYRSLVFSLIISLLLTAPVGAQSITPDISVTLNPSDPHPGEMVEATLESFTIDLNEALITWRYNNTIASSGQGKKSVRVVAPSSDAPATLSVSVKGVEGSANTDIVVRSASIDMIWEATDSYTPAFYKGKALAPVGGSLRIVGIPSATAPKSLTYNWKYNGEAVPTQSGKGRSALLLQTDNLGQNEKIELTVSGGSFYGSGTTTIPLRTPSVVMYEKINGFIDFSTGSTNKFNLSKPSATLRFEPFNISTYGSLESSVSSSISLGGEPLDEQFVFNEAPIVKPDGSGQSTIKITINSIKKVLQTITQSFVIQF